MCIIIAPVMAATQYSLEAYTLAPNAKWTSGNTKGYLEGQFVPYRLGITNYPGVATEPQECIEIDYHANSGEYGFDKADFFYIGPVGDTNTPVPGTPPNTYGAGFTPITTNNAAAFWVDTAPTEVTTSTGTLLHYCVHFNTAPGTNFAIYWGSHLARTSYPISKDYGVQTYTPDVTYEGASYYPGSSLHTHATPANRDVSQPTPPASAEKTGMKFNDANGNHVKDGTEAGLGGWTIYVDINGDGQLTPTGLDPEPFAITSSAPATLGQYHIFGIPAPGSGTTLAWPVREMNQNGWVCSYPTTVDAFGCKYTESFTSGVVETGNDFGNLVPTPEVSKTAAGTYDETHTWTVKKTVDPASVVGFAGDTLPYTWKIVVDDTPTLGNYAVKGIITVKNTDPGAQMVVDLTDKLDDGTSAVIANSVSCAYSGTTLTIPAGATASCAYTATPSGTTATLNTATVKLGAVTKPATATVAWTKNIIDGSATLTDNHGINKVETGDDTVTIPDSYTCPTDLAKYTDGKFVTSDTNTATLAWDKTSAQSTADESITCYALKVTKDATTGSIKTCTWDLDKSVNIDSWKLYRGDSGIFKFTLTPTVKCEDSERKVTGNINVYNPATIAAPIKSVSDLISPDIAVTPVCGVSFPYSLAAGDTLKCTYSADLPDETSRTNTATATLQNTPSGTTDFSGDAKVEFGAPASIIHECVYLKDIDYVTEFGKVDPGTLCYNDDLKPVSYEVKFKCDSGKGSHQNTATLTDAKTDEELDYDTADVNVVCLEAGSAEKTAIPSFTRTWTWQIQKVGDQSALTLSGDQSFLVNYVVTVPAPTFADDKWAVNGIITIKNDLDREMDVTGVVDTVSTAINAPVDCGSDLTIDPGQKLECSYSAALPDTATRTNTANADISYATSTCYFDGSDKVCKPDGGTETQSFPALKSVTFDGPTNIIDECTAVSDTYAGSLGTLCAGVDTFPKTFPYSRTIGPFGACGEYDVDNTAAFKTNDNGKTGEASWHIDITIPCGGCTLTPGYWKTHVEPARSKGPRFDETWLDLNAIPQDSSYRGSYEPFFDTGKDWWTIFWTPPKGGDAYLILAHQYEAAKLNTLTDPAPSVPANVVTAIADAESLLNQYDGTPLSMDGLKGKNANTVRSEFLKVAGILGDFNSGKLGPLHCDEDKLSDNTGI